MVKGQLNVVGSASSVKGTGPFVSYWNGAYNNWDEHGDVFASGRRRCRGPNPQRVGRHELQVVATPGSGLMSLTKPHMLSREQSIRSMATPTPTSTPNPDCGMFSGRSYIIGAGYIIDVGFYQAHWGYPRKAEAYANNQPNLWQQLTFAATGKGLSL
jgi:hypothetical protein